MSALIFNDDKDIRRPTEIAEAPATTFVDVMKASFTDRFLNETSVSKDWALQGGYDDRAKTYKSLTGRELKDDAFEGLPPQNRPINLESAAYDSDEQLKLIDQHILKMKTQDPEKFGSLETNDQILEKVKAKAQGARQDLQKTLAGADQRPFVPLTNISKSDIAGFAGSMGAEFTDPVNIATMPLGAARGMKILKAAATEAGVNMGAELARQPEIVEWQKQLGHEYGFGDAATNVGFAGIFGFGFGGAGAAIGGPPKVKSGAEFFSALEAKAIDAGAPKEILDVIKQQAREAHLRESNPFYDMPDLDAGGHQKSLKEVDAAIREGRPIKTENLGVTPEDFKKIDTTIKPEDTMLAQARKAELENFKPVDGVDVHAENARKLDELMGRASPESGTNPAPVRSESAPIEPEAAKPLKPLTPDEVKSNAKTGKDLSRKELLELNKKIDQKIEASRGINEPEARARVDKEIDEMVARRTELAEENKRWSMVEAETPAKVAPRAARVSDEMFDDIMESAPDGFHPDRFPDTEVKPEEARTLLEASDVRARQEKAPENLKLIDAEVEKYLNDIKAENIPIHIDGVKTDTVGFKNELARQKNVLDSIRVCGVPGGAP